MALILIVEDEKPINELIARNLKLIGHTCEQIFDLKKYWRYRVGDYRLIADINDDQIQIIIFNIGHRKEISDSATESS